MASVQFSSVTQSCPTLSNPMNRSTTPVTSSQSPPKPMSMESVMPLSHPILCRPLLLLPSIFPSIRVFLVTIPGFHVAVLCRVQLLQSCPTPVPRTSPPGSSLHGISQARVLEWVAMPSVRGSSQPGIEPRYLMSPSLAGGVLYP